MLFMINALFNLVLDYTHIVIISLLVFKTALFLNFNRGWSIKHFFYFSFFNVFDTDDFKIQAQKKIQNRLSIIILLALLFQTAIILYKEFY